MNPRYCLALVLLAGCAGPTTVLPGDPSWKTQTPATADEISTARTALLSCLRTRAQELDDRTSDARVIGGAIAASCGRQSDLLLDELARAKSAYEIEILARKWRGDMLDLATVQVLQIRAARAAAKP